MSKILEQDGNSGLDITSSASVGSVTPDRDLALAARLKLTSLNAAAATFTLRLVDSGNYVLASLAVPKDTAAHTTGYLYIEVPLVKSGEAVTLKVESSNSSDTSVTWETEWIDADWANTGLVEGAAVETVRGACEEAVADAELAEAADLATVDTVVDAIKTVTDGLANVDSTGTETVSARKALELLLAVMVNKAARDDVNSDWSVKGRDDTTDLLTGWPVPSATGRNKATIA